MLQDRSGFSRTTARLLEQDDVPKLVKICSASRDDDTSRLGLPARVLLVGAVRTNRGLLAVIDGTEAEVARIKLEGTKRATLEELQLVADYLIGALAERALQADSEE